MNQIDKLGERIEAAWRETSYDHAAFPRIARDAMEAEIARAPRLGVDDVVRWMYQSPSVPQQGRSGGFGEPAITLFAGRRFFIDALFWLDGTTSIHQHGFSGAFHVLAGGSLHTRYAFAPRRQIGDYLQLGELRALSSEWLRTGETREVHGGSALIHALFHLDRPSVTLLARTYFDPGSAPQFSYLRPGIAINRLSGDTRLLRVLDLFAVAYETALPEREALVGEFLATADLHSALLVLERLASIDPAELERLVRLVAARDAELGATAAAAIEELRRQRLVVGWRSVARAADHRFVLALLLNLDGRDAILRLVQQRWPDVDPIERLVACLGEMSPPGAAHGTAQDRVGYELGPAELQILALLLRGRSPAEVLAALAEEFDDVAEQAADVEALCRALQRTPLLSPLFR